MDALSDVLETVHLHGSVYCRSELTAPWGMSIPQVSQAQFHVVRRGRCWILVEGDEPVLLEAGDLVMLPHGTAHTLADRPNSPTRPLFDLVATCMVPRGHEGKPPLRHGGGGQATTLLCGYFRFDGGTAHPLLSVLPRVVLLRGEGGRARRWLEAALDLIADETVGGSPGSESLVNRLTAALFIQVVRLHLDQRDELDPSWLAGLRDPRIAHALGLIHGEVSAPWTVEALARQAGMSRSAFSARFSELVGEPPLRYLTRWRMQVAANHLAEDRLSLSQVAEEVGYQAEAAFHKAFKRMMGVTPGAWRREARA